MSDALIDEDRDSSNFIFTRTPDGRSDEYNEGFESTPVSNLPCIFKDSNKLPCYPIHYLKMKPIQLKEFSYPHDSIISSEDTSSEESCKTLADSIQNLQSYVPIYQQFFKLNELNYNNISLNHRYHIKDQTHVIDPLIDPNIAVERDVFIKFSPLLDPIRYMSGKYNLNDPITKNLPTYNSSETDTHPKILSPSNASYVDGFFYYLSSVVKNHHNFIHGIDFYGSHLGIQDRFKMNIEDDLDYLSNSPFFLANLGKLMVLDNCPPNALPLLHTGSRGVHPSLSISEEDCSAEMDLDMIEINQEPIPEPVKIQVEEPIQEPVKILVEEPIVDIMQEGDDNNSKSDSDSKSDSGSDSDSKSDSGSDICSDDDSENSHASNTSSEHEAEKDQEDDDDEDWETESEEDDEEDSKEATAYIFDYPVQMIFLEKCKNTLDDLFMKDLPDDQACSALFQIVMILLVYQKMFKFTHNDLHTNNIMYIETTEPFLWYRYQQKVYKIPTYGRIFKIIDYGRSIYKYQQQIFCSDSFAPGGDAATQYNCEPYFKSTKPRLEPNMGFDLCRLGCSIFDFVFGDSEPESEPTSDLQRTIQRWCRDDEGKNVMYKKNGSERYPGFKLYKMIARTSHHHTPEAQLQDQWFRQFMIQDQEEPSEIMDIDTYPEYYSS